MSTESISTAIRVLRESPDSSDEEIFSALVRAGVGRNYAARLVEFIPMVYCRLLLSNSRARFSDKFRRRIRESELSSEHLLASEAVWIEVSDFAKAEASRGFKKEKWFALAARSAEFDTINRMLNQGADLANVILTPVLLNWPEEGPSV